MTTTNAAELNQRIGELEALLQSLTDAYANEIAAISNGEDDLAMRCFAKGAALRILAREALNKP